MLTDQLYARAELYCRLHVPIAYCVCMGEAAKLHQDNLVSWGMGCGASILFCWHGQSLFQD
jgi:hypothetical protein